MTFIIHKYLRGGNVKIKLRTEVLYDHLDEIINYHIIPYSIKLDIKIVTKC